MRSTLLHNIVIKWAKAKVHVYSDSVLCLGKMYEHSEAKIQGVGINFKTSNRPTDTENYLESMENQLGSSGICSQDSHHCRFSHKIQEKLDARETRPGM